jgi:hypothetical protein
MPDLKKITLGEWLVLPIRLPVFPGPVVAGAAIINW